MGTRSGDVDAGVLTFLERADGLTPAQCEELLNKKSGLLGLSGISSDMREILAAAGEGKPRALVALKAYCYRVRKYLGAYVAAMGGLDAIVFTGGVGQGSAEVRALSLQGLGCMGVELDEAKNRDARGFDEVCRVSTDGSRVVVLIVPTDEERMLAREALRALSRSSIARVLAAQERSVFPVEVSPKHVLLTAAHVEALFGRGHRLAPAAALSQPGRFVSRERVAIVGPKGRVDGVAVFGPTRPYTEVVIAMTEQFALGLHAPIRESGDIAGTPGCMLEGPAGSVKLEHGVICAMRHVHMTPEDALRFGVRDRSIVRVRTISGRVQTIGGRVRTSGENVRTGSEREFTFGDVLVRVDPESALALNIDADEAGAAGVQSGDQATIDGIQSEG
jgi:acetate kinase